MARRALSEAATEVLGPCGTPRTENAVDHPDGVLRGCYECPWPDEFRIKHGSPLAHQRCQLTTLLSTSPEIAAAAGTRSRPSWGSLGRSCIAAPCQGRPPRQGCCRTRFPPLG